MLSALKRRAMRHKWLIIAWAIRDNLRMKRRLRSGRAETDSGATHATMTLEQSVQYVHAVHDDYLRQGELSPGDLAGARILELGPGDNLGVALLFLAGGAREVVCLDRFHSRRDARQQRRVYAALREELAGVARERFDAALESAGSGMDRSPLRYVYGRGIEEAAPLFDPASFDLIVSRAVLEHLFDPAAAFDAMDRLLAPAGRMLHKVDLRDHGLFSAAGYHPLEFLTLPESVYRAMSSHSGRPNRRRIDFYRSQLAVRGYDARFRITHATGVETEIVPPREALERGADYGERSLALIASIRPRLATPFRALADEALLASGFFVVARRVRNTAL